MAASSMRTHLSSLRHAESPLQAPKHVLIDASPVTMSQDGLSVYIVNLIKHLAACKIEDLVFTILLNPAVHLPELDQAINDGGMHALRVPIASIGPRRDWDMFWFLRKHRSSFDLIHITSNNYPLGLPGGLATIHDVTFKRWFDRKAGIPGSAWLARLYMDRVIRRCLKRADAIIAVSESTKREINLQFGATPAQMRKISVIHEGWEHLAGEDETWPALTHQPGGYLFNLGAYRVHKNLVGLLEGFRLALPSIPARKRLVIGGSGGQIAGAYRSLVDQINAQGERVIFTGYLPTAEVRALYRKADAFIFPSLSEGFGLPVLEAFHHGTPLLCSATTSLPEIAGDAALYFDPADPSAIANAIVQFYSDPDAAARMRAKGTERLKAFSWGHTAAQTAALYRRLLGLAA